MTLPGGLSFARMGRAPIQPTACAVAKILSVGTIQQTVSPL